MNLHVAIGGPNSNDLGTNHILHHTIGKPDWGQEHRCFQQVTCESVSLEPHQMIIPMST